MTTQIRLVLPHRLGWLRRPELDKLKRSQVWEKPNGELVLHSGKHQLLVPVPQRREKEHG